MCVMYFIDVVGDELICMYYPVTPNLFTWFGKRRLCTVFGSDVETLCAITRFQLSCEYCGRK